MPPKAVKDIERSIEQPKSITPDKDDKMGSINPGSRTPPKK